MIRPNSPGAERSSGLLRRGVGSMRSNPAAWIIALAVVIRIPLLFTGLTYSSDIWRQSDTASIARNFWSGGFNLFFPAINWGGSGPGYVESEFQLYPFCVALLYQLSGGEHVWLGKLVSLGLTAGTLGAFWGLARRVVERDVALTALAFFAVAPISLRYGTAFMPEAAVLFFSVAALLWFVRWLQEDQSRLLAWSGVAMGLAILVKPTAIHVGLVLAIMVVRARGWKAARDPHLWLVAALVLAPIVGWTIHARHLHLRYGNTFGVISGGDRKFATLDTFTSTEFYTGVLRTEVLWVLGVGAVPLFLLGLIVTIRRREPTLLIAGVVTIPIFYAVVAKYAQGPQGIQYHVFALPYASLGVGLGLQRLRKWSAAENAHRRWAQVATLGTVGMFALVTVASYVRFFPEQNQIYTECARHVREVVPEKDLIVVSSKYESQVDGYDVNFQEPMIFFYSDHRGWSLAADRHHPDALDAIRRDGADWFVAYDRELVDQSDRLKRYLDREATQLGPGIDAACGIWRLDA